MPLMVPISDLLHINRQITVLAFQYGDSISNVLFPTSAILMGALAVGKISYTVAKICLEINFSVGHYMLYWYVNCLDDRLLINMD